MSPQSADLARVFVSLTVLLVAAHTGGHVFAVLRQPPVVGEILGGLLLGPTVLGLVAPGAQAWLLPSSGPVAVSLGLFSELGLLLLLFLSGREVPALDGGSKRSVLAMTVTGLVIPFAAGLGAVQLLDYRDFSGPLGTEVGFAMVFGIGIAVTSIPVISRIMLDLDLMKTHFARVVLSVALLEDIVLYAGLAAILGLAQSRSTPEFGLSALVDEHARGMTTGYHVVASIAFFAVFLPLGRPLFGVLARSRFNVVQRRSASAFRLVFLLTLVLVCVFLGVNPIFGALVAGIVSAGADRRDGEEPRRQDAEQAWEALRRIALAVFIPVYFAGVGARLDLVRHFTVPFFIAFLLLACVVKSASIWLGARLAGEPNRIALDFAVALNARGGPGIVLATVTLSAGVINDAFYTTLVLLSIVTSQLAGLWLQHAAVFRPVIAPSGGRHAQPETVARSHPV